MQNKMILLFGMPRSGTTWIGKLFDSHPETFYLHEPDSVKPDYSLPLLVGAEQLPQYQQQIENLLADWMQVKHEKVTASRPFFHKNYMNTLQWQLFQLSAYTGKVLARGGIKNLLHPLRLHQANKTQVVVWKSIESLGRIGALAKAADALPIQLIRHPCGNIASTFRGETGGQFDGSVTTAEDWDLYKKLLQQSGNQQFSLEEVKKMQPEERLTLRWGIINDFALQQVERLQGRLLKYEDVCCAPLKQVEQIFDWAGLNMAEASKTFIQESTTGHDDAYYATKKDPLVAVYSWKTQLTNIQITNVYNMMQHFHSGRFYQDEFEGQQVD